MTPTRVSIPQVVTQPYDKITPEMQDGYYAASPHNLVRVILGKEHASDHTRENRYTRAAQSFRDWRHQGIFLQDAQPSLYLYVERFTAPGGTAEMERRGIIALGRIEDYSDGVVFRHEQTLAKPKADRLELLRATRAHFGQLFMLYSDPAGEIDGVMVPTGSPDLETKDEYGVSHLVWKISDQTVVSRVQHKMRDKKLVIADGHHRYETALNYRNEQRAAVGNPNPSPDAAPAPYDLVMMTLVNMDSPGLVILPTHRVVHGLPSFSAAAFREGPAPISAWRRWTHRSTQPAPRSSCAKPDAWVRPYWRSPPIESFFSTAPSWFRLRSSRDGRCANKPSTWCNCTSACSRACWGFRKKPFVTRETSAIFGTLTRPQPKYAAARPTWLF